MKVAIIVTSVFLGACNHQTLQPKLQPKQYVIISHTVIPEQTVERNGWLTHELQVDNYTVRYGEAILMVTYESSQTTSAKPGDFFGTGLHMHSARFEPDLSQVPLVGEPINACRMSKDVLSDGGPIIDHQPTSVPCMAHIGDKLQYEPAPNAGDLTYVAFDIRSEKVQ
jgi:hypothetical protein